MKIEKENLSKEDVNINIDKNYLKNLQRNHQKHNKRYKTSRSTLTHVNPNAGNVEYNIAMFNHMNNPQGKVINPFNFDGSSLIANADVGNSTSGDVSNVGGEISVSAGGMGENLSFDEAWELMNSLDEDLLTEAKDERDGLKNLLAVKKLSGGTGCVWYDNSGKVVDTLSLSALNLDGDSLATTATRMKELMKEKNASSFRLYHKGNLKKPVYDSINDIGKQKDNGESFDTIVRVAKKSNPDEIDIITVKDGAVTLPTSEGNREFKVENISKFCKELYDLNDSEYLYYVSNDNDELFNTATPTETPIGKSLGITKETKFGNFVNKVKNKMGIGIVTPEWGKKETPDDYYWAYLDENGNELWRVYIRAKTAEAKDATDIKKESQNRVKNADSIRPAVVGENHTVANVVLYNASGKVATPVVKAADEDVTVVVFVKNKDGVVEAKAQAKIHLPKSGASIEDRINNYIKSDTNLTAYTSDKNVCVEFYNSKEILVYFVDKFNIRRDSTGKLLAGQEVYKFNHVDKAASDAVKETPTSEDSVKAEEAKPLVIADGVTEIGAEQYMDNKAISEVTIPDTVTKIGDRAFYNCVNLVKAVIPNSVKTMGINVFVGCSQLVIYTDNELVTKYAEANRIKVEALTKSKEETAKDSSTETAATKAEEKPETTTAKTEEKPQNKGAAGISSTQIMNDIGKLNSKTRNKMIRDLINQYGDGTGTKIN